MPGQPAPPFQPSRFQSWCLDCPHTLALPVLSGVDFLLKWWITRKNLSHFLPMYAGWVLYDFWMGQGMQESTPTHPFLALR